MPTRFDWTGVSDQLSVKQLVQMLNIRMPRIAQAFASPAPFSAPVMIATRVAPTVSPLLSPTLTIEGIVGSGNQALGISVHMPTKVNFTVADQVGVYSRVYGAVSAISANRVLEGLTTEAAPQFTFTAPNAGNVLGAECVVKVQGMATGGDLNGTIFGAYAHADVSGPGHGATIDTAVGVWADIGNFSSGNNYTMRKACSIVARRPNAVNLGTITASYGIFTDGPLGLGAWPAIGNTFATPGLVLDPAGTVSFAKGSDPAPPSTGTAVLYVKDNGSGKGQLAVRFPTGGVQILATEP